MTATKRPYRFRPAEEIEQLPSPKWLIDHVIPEDSFTILYGPSGAGKTFAALDFALSLGTGTDWLGRSVRMGRVAYICAEGGAALSPRLKAWRQEHCNYIGALGVDILTRPVPMLDTVAVDAVLGELSVLPQSPVLIVVDTLARNFGGGDENSAKDMGVFVDALDRLRQSTGAAMLVVHHTGLNGDRERGSSALHAAADTALYLHETTKNSSALALVCKKQKDAVPFDDIKLSRQTVTLPHGASSCVIVGRSDITHETERSPSQSGQRILTLLALRFDGQRTRGADIQAAADMSETTFGRHANKLRDDGLIDANHQGYVLTDDGRRHAIPMLGLTDVFTPTSPPLDLHGGQLTAQCSPPSPPHTFRCEGEGEGPGVNDEGDAWLAHLGIAS